MHSKVLLLAALAPLIQAATIGNLFNPNGKPQVVKYTGDGCPFGTLIPSSATNETYASVYLNAFSVYTASSTPRRKPAQDLKTGCKITWALPVRKTAEGVYQKPSLLGFVGTGLLTTDEQASFQHNATITIGGAQSITFSKTEEKRVRVGEKTIGGSPALPAALRVDGKCGVKQEATIDVSMAFLEPTTASGEMHLVTWPFEKNVADNSIGLYLEWKDCEME